MNSLGMPSKLGAFSLPRVWTFYITLCELFHIGEICGGVTSVDDYKGVWISGVFLRWEWEFGRGRTRLFFVEMGVDGGYDFLGDIYDCRVLAFNFLLRR
jgi:hypothetical protein